MEFEDKFIGYVDILGFKNMVAEAERGQGRSLTDIRELLSELRRQKDAVFYEQHGPHVCPHSAFTRRDLNFEVTQISDCVVVSAEVSPAGVINLVNHCWAAAMMLLTRGVMVRGYITRGRIVHRGTEIIGTGYQEAYAREPGVSAFKQEADEKGTPFVEVDPSVCDYVRNETDECVRKMFGRCVRSDGTVTALFPFQRLSHSFIIGGFGRPTFDPDLQKRNNDQVRQNIHKLKARLLEHAPAENPAATRKLDHYLRALDAQLAQCDMTDEMIDDLMRPIGRSFPP